jgi:hypothetical protein
MLAASSQLWSAYVTRPLSILISLVGVALSSGAASCVSRPTPEAPRAPEPFGTPIGLAWIEAQGDVAIHEGAVEHVLMPRRTGTAAPPAPSAPAGPPAHLSMHSRLFTHGGARHAMTPTEVLDASSQPRERTGGELCPTPP